MPISMNGTGYFSIFPSGSRNSYEDSDSRHFQSVNTPQICQVLVQYGSEGLSDPPANAGDVVNVLFDIYVSKNYSMTPITNVANKIATIRKGVDIMFDYEYGKSLGPLGAVGNPAWSLTDGSLDVKIFTIDIAPLLRTELNYSLVPIGRGSFNSSQIEGNLGGGFNGNYGDTVYGTLNDGMIHVWVRARFEILNEDGLIEMAYTGGNETVIDPKDSWDGLPAWPYQAINSAPQWDEDPRKLFSYEMRARTGTTYRDKKFLSNCPNGDTSATWTTTTPRYYKTARVLDTTDCLYFYLFQVEPSTSLTTYSGQYAFQSRVFRIYMKVEILSLTGVATWKYLNQDQDAFFYSVGHNQVDSLGYGFGADDYTKYLTSRQYTKMWLSQNVAPDYINNNLGIGTGNISANTHSYRVSLEWEDNEDGACDCLACGCTTGQCCEDPAVAGSWDGEKYRFSEYRYFKIDHSSENAAFPYVRFHWLNRMGGIDSYTCKRTQEETLKSNFSTYEKKPNTLQWQLESTTTGLPTGIEAMLDNTWAPTMNQRNLSIRSEQYQTEVEKLDIQARKSGSVFTEPLNKVESKWLEEIFTSPNVWMEVDNGRGSRANATNEHSHPVDQDYSPVTITNKETLTLNSADDAKLVQFKIQYQQGVSVNTQSN